ncbi:MAG: hypothetical protein Q7S74_00100 [Nanoarchaeota archaeon]|nr:hypothetical protein [Nanoarchaeota archaeon]
MTSTQYGIIEVKQPEHPPRSLLVVPHENNNLIVGFPAFGPGTYSGNQNSMQKSYSHPQTGERISFTPATTAQSISAAAYDFKNLAKPQIFDPQWLQLGYILRTSEGVFVNLPKDKQGNVITDEAILKSHLNGIKPIRIGKSDIYIASNTEKLKDFGFAPYETFQTGIQDGKKFAEGGLARVLEHTEEKANALGKIASTKFYLTGVNVWAFEQTKEPVLRVASLGSGRVSGSGRLSVNGNDWSNEGYAFGVLDSGKASAKNL